MSSVKPTENTTCDNIYKNNMKMIGKKIISTSQVRHLCRCHSKTALGGGEVKDLRPIDVDVERCGIDIDAERRGIDAYVERGRRMKSDNGR